MTIILVIFRALYQIITLVVRRHRKLRKDSFWHNYNTWDVGIGYKPCVTRGRNHHGNFRIGAAVGSDLNRFIGIATAGYEHTYNLYNGWSVFWQVKEDVVLHGQDRFRTGGTIGIKIPL